MIDVSKATLDVIEAIKTKEDMKRVIKEVPGHHMINLIEDGDTPFIDMNELEDIGYKIAVMPLTLMSASVKIMQECLKNMKNKTYNKNVSKFSELREIVGFNEYYDIEDKYKKEELGWDDGVDVKQAQQRQRQIHDETLSDDDFISEVKGDRELTDEEVKEIKLN